MVGRIPLSPQLGFRVEIDASRDLSADEIEALRAAYREGHLLLIRDLNLDREGQIRICSLFGEVLQNDPTPFISNVRKDFVGDNELAWHSDLIYTPAPHLGLSLYAVVADPGVAPTRFINAERALETLPADLRRRIEGLEAVHISAGHGGSARNRGLALEPDWPQWRRPLAEMNPQTGRRFLCMNYAQTSHVVGVPQAESDALLDALSAHLYAPENVYEHHWRTGDLLIWDNLALQHSRDRLQGSGRRDLERIMLGGKLINEQHPEWLAGQKVRMRPETAAC